jgi:hypothetical protein
MLQPGRGTYVLELPSEDIFIDGNWEHCPCSGPRSLGTYANHSAHPNAKFEHWPLPLSEHDENSAMRNRMWLVATEPIPLGGEIRVNYEAGSFCSYWQGTIPSETPWRAVRRAPPLPPSAATPVLRHLSRILRGCTTLPLEDFRDEPAATAWDGPAGGDARLEWLLPHLMSGCTENSAAPKALPWALVATHIPGRTALECASRGRIVAARLERIQPRLQKQRKARVEPSAMLSLTCHGGATAPAASSATASKRGLTSSEPRPAVTSATAAASSELAAAVRAHTHANGCKTLSMAAGSAEGGHNDVCHQPAAQLPASGCEIECPRRPLQGAAAASAAAKAARLARESEGGHNDVGHKSAAKQQYLSTLARLLPTPSFEDPATPKLGEADPEQRDHFGDPVFAGHVCFSLTVPTDYAVPPTSAHGRVSESGNVSSVRLQNLVCAVSDGACCLEGGASDMDLLKGLHRLAQRVHGTYGKPRQLVHVRWQPAMPWLVPADGPPVTARLDIWLAEAIFTMRSDYDIWLMMSRLQPCLPILPKPIPPRRQPLPPGTPQAYRFSLAGLMRSMESAGYSEAEQPSALKLSLFSFQRQSLQWMLDRERMEGGLNMCLWEEHPLLPGQRTPYPTPKPC